MMELKETLYDDVFEAYEEFRVTAVMVGFEKDDSYGEDDDNLVVYFFQDEVSIRIEFFLGVARVHKISVRVRGHESDPFEELAETSDEQLDLMLKLQDFL